MPWIRAEFHVGPGHQSTAIMYVWRDKTPPESDARYFLTDLAEEVHWIRHSRGWRGEYHAVRGLPVEVKEEMLKSLHEGIPYYKKKRELVRDAPIVKRKEKYINHLEVV